MAGASSRWLHAGGLLRIRAYYGKSWKMTWNCRNWKKTPCFTRSDFTREFWRNMPFCLCCRKNISSLPLSIAGEVGITWHILMGFSLLKIAVSIRQVWQLKHCQIFRKKSAFGNIWNPFSRQVWQKSIKQWKFRIGRRREGKPTQKIVYEVDLAYLPLIP